MVLQKCVRYEADEKPHVSLTCTHASISKGCTTHVGPDYEACSLQLGREEVAALRHDCFLNNLAMRVGPWSGLPLLPLAVLFLLIWTILVLPFHDGGPLLTLIWAWVLSQVPCGTGEMRQCGKRWWFFLCIQAGLRAASLLPFPLLHVHLYPSLRLT